MAAPVPKASEIIRQAYILAQVWDPGEEQTDDQANEGLLLLNSIINEWSSKNTLIPAYTTLTIPLELGDSKINQTIVVTDLLEGHISDAANCQDALYEMNLQEYNRMDFNNTSGRPDRVYIEIDEANIQTKTNFYFWPPADGDYTATLYVKKTLAEFDYADTVTTVPLSYFKALKYQLAYDLRDLYNTILPPSFDRQHIDLINTLKGINRKDLSVQVVNPFFENRRFRTWNVFSN